MRFSIFVFISIFWLSLNAQSTITSRYLDIEVSENKVYTHTTTNKMVIWDVVKDTVLSVKKQVSCIGLQHNNLGAYISSEGAIMAEDANETWKAIGTVKGTPYFLLFDSKNKPAVLTDKGLYYNKRFFLPTEMHRIGNNEVSIDAKKMSKPTLTYVDKDDNIWITYDLGHFSELYIFDTKKGIFIRNKVLYVKDDKKETDYEKYLRDYREKQLKKYPFYVKKDQGRLVYKFPTELPIHYGIKSITQDNKGHYYFSEGLAFSNKKNGFFIYEKSNIPDFYKPIEKLEKDFKAEEEILGPLTFNTFNNSLYYYSSLGFFRIVPSVDRIRKELIIDPNTLLYNKLIPHVYGHLMQVTEFHFLDEERFVFLTTEYGFGYYDGENLAIFN